MSTSTTRHYYAAIGTDGTRPVVCGLATTPELAISAAERRPVSGWGSSSWSGWDARGTATVQVSRATARRIRDGEFDCATLGITVEIRRGRLVGATRATLGGRRPVGPAALSRSVQVRISEADHELVSSAARRGGTTASEWLRRHGVDAAKTVQDR